MTYLPRTIKALRARQRRRVQQFGQPNDRSVRNGALGCTHTVLQYLAYLWLGRWYTLDQVSALAGYPAGVNRGLRPTEVQRFCTKVGLPYVVRLNLPWTEVLRIANTRGPVGFGHSYSRWPEQYGAVYLGVRADGRPNGYASPRGRPGRTQLTGFLPPNDAHFGVVFGWDPTRGASTARVVGWEPNHGSPARPELPAYEAMTTAQFEVVYESYQRILGRTPYALIPTRSLPL